MTPRRRRRHPSTFVVLLGLVVFALVLRGVASRGAPAGGAAASTFASSPHLALGMPTDADPRDDVLLDERAYVVSYNPEKLAPNWCAWRLDRSHLGHAGRRDDYRADETLPFGIHRVTPFDYRHTGYERGHLCPSADRSASPEMNSITFLMTNMVPQVHELNGGPWEKLEERERSMALASDAHLLLVAGPVFDATPPRMAHGIAVPRATWKIIIVLGNGQTAAEVTQATELVAVMMPNVPEVGGHGWTEYVTSVDEIERQTGYDFLAALPDDVERAIEARTAAPR